MTLIFNAGRVAASAVAALALTLVGSVSASAAAVTDPPNDFLSTFNGPHNGDLDVLAANATLNGPNLDFTATLNGTVGETAGAVYVFGVDRGMGTPKFANIDKAGVIFDSTFVINGGGTGTLNDLIAKTSTPVSDVTLSGTTISGVVPVSDLPSEGFSPNNYTFNLWPESGAANAGNTEISDFAPDNAMAPVTAVTATPEPASVSLCGMAAVGALVLLRRRKLA